MILDLDLAERPLFLVFISESVTRMLGVMGCKGIVGLELCPTEVEPRGEGNGPRTKLSCVPNTNWVVGGGYWAG